MGGPLVIRSARSYFCLPTRLVAVGKGPGQVRQRCNCGGHGGAKVFREGQCQTVLQLFLLVRTHGDGRASVLSSFDQCS